MREALLGTALLVAATGPGAASSILTLRADPPASGASIVLRGETTARPVEARPVDHLSAEIFAISRSVVAFGAEAIPAAREEVSSIGLPHRPERPRWSFEAAPHVIRGGMAGDAFAAPAAPRASDGQAATPSPPQAPRPPQSPRQPEPSPPPQQPDLPFAPFSPTQ